jgi:hypothetical protein
VRAAVRLEPDADFLCRHIPDYNLKPVINIEVISSSRILSFSTRGEAYPDPTIVVGYESTEGNRMQEALVQHRAAELKREDVGFPLINDSDSLVPDLKQNSINLGLSLLAKSNETARYRIE